MKNLNGDQNISSHIYAIGGFSNSTVCSSVSCFDPKEKKWTERASMSIARACFGATTFRDEIIVCGGQGDGCPFLDSVEIYNPKADEWRTLASMKKKRRLCSVAELNGRIYVSGGANATVERYTPAESSTDDEESGWREVASMKVPRFGHEMVAYGDQLYVIGGLSHRTAERYDPQTDQWMSLACPKLKHENFGAAVHKDKIYVCSEQGCEVYDPLADQWAPLSQPENIDLAMKLVALDNQLYLVGGEDVEIVQSFHFDTGRWSFVADMDVPRAFHGLVTLSVL